MRDYFARALVRFVASWWDRSFEAHSNCQFVYAKAYAKVGKLVGKPGLAFASLLDREACGQQMVEEGWWG